MNTVKVGLNGEHFKSWVECVSGWYLPIDGGKRLHLAQVENGWQYWEWPVSITKTEGQRAVWESPHGVTKTLEEAYLLLVYKIGDVVAQ